MNESRYQLMSNPTKRQPLHLLYPGRYMEDNYHYTGNNIPNENPRGLYRTKEINDNLQMIASSETEAISRRLGGKYPIISHPAVDPSSIVEDPRLVGLNMEGNSGLDPNYQYTTNPGRYEDLQQVYQDVNNNNNYEGRNEYYEGINEYNNNNSYNNNDDSYEYVDNILPKYNWHRKAEEVGYDVSSSSINSRQNINQGTSGRGGSNINIREYDKNNNQKKSSTRENYTKYKMNYDSPLPSSYIHTHEHTHEHPPPSNSDYSRGNGINYKKYSNYPAMATSRSSKIPRREILSNDYDDIFGNNNRVEGGGRGGNRDYRQQPVGASNSSDSVIINETKCSTPTGELKTCVITNCTTPSGGFGGGTKTGTCTQITCTCGGSDSSKNNCTKKTCTMWDGNGTSAKNIGGCDFTDSTTYTTTDGCTYEGSCKTEETCGKDEPDEPDKPDVEEPSYNWWLIGLGIFALIFVIFLVWYFGFREKTPEDTSLGGAYNGTATPGFSVDQQYSGGQQQQQYSGDQYSGQPLQQQYSEQCIPLDNGPIEGGIIQSSDCSTQSQPQQQQQFQQPQQQQSQPLPYCTNQSQSQQQQQQQPYQVLNFYNGLPPSM
jgi:hypothetical protein